MFPGKLTHLTSASLCVVSLPSLVLPHGAAPQQRAEPLINVTPSSTRNRNRQTALPLHRGHHVESVRVLQSHSSRWISLLPCSLQVRLRLLLFFLLHLFCVISLFLFNESCLEMSLVFIVSVCGDQQGPVLGLRSLKSGCCF